MSEITVQELNDLQEQKAIYEKQLSALDINNPIHAIERSALTDEINVVSNKISEKKWEMQQKEAQIEEKVHSEGVPFAVSGVDFTQLPADLITVIELVVKADRRRIYADHATEIEKAGTEHAKTVNILQTDLNSQAGIIETGTADNKRLIQENGDLRDHSNKQKLEIDDLTIKLSNAATQLDEKNAEIAQLKSQIDDYQKAKVFGEREAQNVIEAEPQEADAINAALKKLYVSYENWGSTNKVVKPDGTFELVKNADLHEWVPETEVNGQNSFRDESGQTNTTDTENSGVLDTEAITPPAITFPAISDAQPADGLDEGNTRGEVAPETVGREEFEALKQRVANMERNMVGDPESVDLLMRNTKEEVA